MVQIRNFWNIFIQDAPVALIILQVEYQLWVRLIVSYIPETLSCIKKGLKPKETIQYVVQLVKKL